ncbi:hypothetical protein HDU79_009679 [Rhizoclosmatium sp. JEL0117]|nr:hypothetical protein HDU79_009679 [Rhizoclosmatium sp. JEL0117]
MTALLRLAFLPFQLVVIAIAAQVVADPTVTSREHLQHPNPQQLLTFAQQFCFAKNTINTAIIGCGVQAQSPMAYALAQALSGYVSNFCTNAASPVCGLNLVSTTPYLQPILNAFQLVDAARFTEVLTAGTCAQDAKAKLIQALTTCVDASLDFSGLCPPDLIPTSIDMTSETTETTETTEIIATSDATTINIPTTKEMPVSIPVTATSNPTRSISSYPPSASQSSSTAPPADLQDIANGEIPALKPLDPVSNSTTAAITNVLVTLVSSSLNATVLGASLKQTTASLLPGKAVKAAGAPISSAGTAGINQIVLVIVSESFQISKPENSAIKTYNNASSSIVKVDSVQTGFALTYTLPNFITSEWFVFTYEPEDKTITLLVNRDHEVLLNARFSAIPLGKKRGSNDLTIINGAIPIQNDGVATTVSTRGLTIVSTASTAFMTSAASTASTVKAISSISTNTVVPVASGAFATTSSAQAVNTLAISSPIPVAYYAPNAGATKLSTESKNLYASGATTHSISLILLHKSSRLATVASLQQKKQNLLTNTGLAIHSEDVGAVSVGELLEKSRRGSQWAALGDATVGMKGNSGKDEREVAKEEGAECGCSGIVSVAAEGSDLLAFPNDLMILEDVFGKVQVKGVLEVHVRTAEEVLAVIERGAAHRRTEGTSKNATSSRSHAICRIRVKNLSRPEAEDGVLHLLDLAGSESSADTRWHNKERVLESVGINKSLATLKECIQKRAAVDDVGTSGVRQHIHVPYRSSKLTMLLKDAFEVASGRACRTVVIAMVNPSILDTPQSLSTLRYVAPLKMMKQGSKHMTDPNDPREWTNTELCARVSALYRSIDTNILCPYESGKQILRLSEAEFIERCTHSPGLTVKAAKDFYDKIWGLVIDARSKRNKRDC